MPQTQAATVYRWTDLPKDVPMAQLERRRIIGANVMLSEVLLEKGCAVPTHTHENEQFACVVRGRLLFGVGAEGSTEREDVEVKTGEVLHLPSNVPHSVVALEESLVLDGFSPTSQKTGIDSD